MIRIAHHYHWVTDESEERARKGEGSRVAARGVWWNHCHYSGRSLKLAHTERFDDDDPIKNIRRAAFLLLGMGYRVSGKDNKPKITERVSRDFTTSRGEGVVKEIRYAVPVEARPEDWEQVCYLIRKEDSEATLLDPLEQLAEIKGDSCSET